MPVFSSGVHRGLADRYDQVVVFDEDLVAKIDADSPDVSKPLGKLGRA
jgi:hypothetical protein